jgi:hypothetical protein
VSPDKTVAVREINLVYFVSEPMRCGRWAGRRCEMFLFPSLPAELKGTFGFSGRFEVDGFQVNTYRSQEPVRLKPKVLVGDPKVALIYRYQR